MTRRSIVVDQEETWRLFKTPPSEMSDEDLSRVLEESIMDIEYEKAVEEGFDPTREGFSRKEVKMFADRGRAIMREIRSRPHLTVVYEVPDEDVAYYGDEEVPVLKGVRTNPVTMAVAKRRRNPDHDLKLTGDEYSEYYTKEYRDYLLEKEEDDYLRSIKHRYTQNDKDRFREYIKSRAVNEFGSVVDEGKLEDIIDGELVWRIYRNYDITSGDALRHAYDDVVAHHEDFMYSSGPRSMSRRPVRDRSRRNPVARAVARRHNPGPQRRRHHRAAAPYNNPIPQTFVTSEGKTYNTDDVIPLSAELIEIYENSFRDGGKFDLQDVAEVDKAMRFWWQNQPKISRHIFDRDLYNELRAVIPLRRADWDEGVSKKALGIIDAQYISVTNALTDPFDADRKTLESYMEDILINPLRRRRLRRY